MSVVAVKDEQSPLCEATRVSYHGLYDRGQRRDDGDLLVKVGKSKLPNPAEAYLRICGGETEQQLLELNKSFIGIEYPVLADGTCGLRRA